jgi:hypothetical protein
MKPVEQFAARTQLEDHERFILRLEDLENPQNVGV